MSSWSSSGRPTIRGRPSGSVTSSWMASRKSVPVTVSMSSASTQWAAVGWYS